MNDFNEIINSDKPTLEILEDKLRIQEQPGK